jgi:hypothetical protein
MSDETNTNPASPPPPPPPPAKAAKGPKTVRLKLLFGAVQQGADLIEAPAEVEVDVDMVGALVAGGQFAEIDA